MLKTSILPSIATGRDAARLQALRAQGREKEFEKERLREVAGEFEALLVEMMVSSMRKNVPESPLLGSSTGREIFQEMLDSEYVRRIVDRGGLGIADMLVNQLGRYL